MIQRAAQMLTDLYESDETAWLETMAELIRANKYKDLDYVHLGEYLSDMAKRDRREVQNRLAILLAHVLNWTYQKKKRSGGWRATIIVQSQELEELVEKGVLRAHADAVLPRAFAKAVKQAAAETGLPPETFPKECPYTVDMLL